jgi:hypothetical protein
MRQYPLPTFCDNPLWIILNASSSDTRYPRRLSKPWAWTRAENLLGLGKVFP